MHLDRASVQTREMQHLITLLKSDPSIPQDELQTILAGGASSKRLPTSAFDDSSTGLLHYQTARTSPASGKPLALQDLEFLSQSQVLKDFCLSVYDSNFMGTFLKCYNQEAQQNTDFLYDAQNRHVDLVTSMKGLFDARHYCYSCHKAFPTVKHLCSANGCWLCRQPGCLNRTGFINLTPLNWTTSSNDLSKTPRQSPVFQCSRCRLKVRSQKCLDCLVTSGVCHLYTLCPKCDNTAPKRAFSNHICSKKRCSTCSVHYSLSDSKNTSSPSSEHQCFVQKPKRCIEREIPDGDTSNEFPDCEILGGENYREEVEKEDPMTQIKRRKMSNAPVDDDGTVTSRDQPENNIARAPSDDKIWVFDIETDQSCGNEGLHKPILLAAESLTGYEVIYSGYDCINDFCEDVFASVERVCQTE